VAIPVNFSTGSLYPFGLDRVYGWATEAGYNRMKIMIDERWDTHQDNFLNHSADKHGVPIVALHMSLHCDGWGLEPGETRVRVAKLADRVGASIVVVHPPPLGRPLARWAAGPLEEAWAQYVSVTVENMARGRAKRLFSTRRRSCHRPEHLFGIGDVTLDTSHLAASELDLMATYSKLAAQLLHVRLSDSNLSGEISTGFPARASYPWRNYSPPSHGMATPAP